MHVSDYKMICYTLYYYPFEIDRQSHVTICSIYKLQKLPLLQKNIHSVLTM